MKSQLTVSEVNRLVKELLETGLGDITVTGEISNFKLHSSGHMYLTLKDDSAQLSAVVWRSRAGRLAMKPVDGMKVVARGRLTVYEVRGVYQLDIVDLRPVGVGELQIAFERLKNKLGSEGLFDPARKKSLPLFPRAVGIATSHSGAALRDIVSVVSRRFPALGLVLRPCQVQGAGAAEEIALAIDELNRSGFVDVIIAGRGGGSMEDLWAFNEETVARAIARSRVPVISAVGHETDFTIADFVADLRAPTPSAAAELAVPDVRRVIASIREFQETGRQLLRDEIRSSVSRVRSAVKSYAFSRPLDLVRRRSQQLDEIDRGLRRSIRHRLDRSRERLNALNAGIANLNPDSILKRGYAAVLREGLIVSSVADLRVDEDVILRFHDGNARSRIIDRTLQKDRK